MSTTTSSGASTPSARYEPPRRRRGGIGRLIAVVVGTLLVVGGAVALIGGLTRDTTTVQDTFAGVTELAVDGQTGHIDIVATGRDDVLVRTEITDSLFASATTSHDVIGDRLELVSSCDRWWLPGTDCKVAYTLEVPADALERVAVDMTAANVTLTGVSGTVDARTTAGNIDLAQYGGPGGELETTAGNVTIDAVEPAGFSIRTTAGEIDVTVPDEVYRVEADTTAGNVDVDVRQDPEAERIIEASTTAGNIAISPR